MKLLLVGAGGYAVNYIQILLKEHNSSLIWEGVVDPFYNACLYKEQIDALNIPVYNTMEEFYEHHSADLAVISTPTFLHCEQSICALSHGSNVLCEKPAAPTVEEAERMMEAEQKYGKFIAIGYQWSYSAAIQRLKMDILKGVLGKPISFKTFISWPRNRAYYSRGSGWGGRIEKDGRLILDSIASNACAHYLHNMLFLLGDTMQTSAQIIGYNAECYRANEIENFDTCCIQLETANGVKLYYAATHAADTVRNPEFVYTFEKGTVLYAQDEGSQIVAKMNDGNEIEYGNPFENSFKKLTDCIEAVKKEIRPLCTVETAFMHVKLIEDMYKTTPIRNFSRDHVYIDDEKDAIYVRGLFQHFVDAYKKEELFSKNSSEFIEC